MHRFFCGVRAVPCLDICGGNKNALSPPTSSNNNPVLPRNTISVFYAAPFVLAFFFRLQQWFRHAAAKGNARGQHYIGESREPPSGTVLFFSFVPPAQWWVAMCWPPCLDVSSRQPIEHLNIIARGGDDGQQSKTHVRGATSDSDGIPNDSLEYTGVLRKYSSVLQHGSTVNSRRPAASRLPSCGS